MKYARMKTLLEAHGITTSDIYMGVSISDTSGSSAYRVRSRLDASSNGGSAHG